MKKGEVVYNEEAVGGLKWQRGRVKMVPLFKGWFWLGVLLVLNGVVKLGARRKIHVVKLKRPLAKWYYEFVPEGAYIMRGLGEIVAGVFFIVAAYQ